MSRMIVAVALLFAVGQGSKAADSDVQVALQFELALKSAAPATKTETEAAKPAKVDRNCDCGPNGCPCGPGCPCPPAKKPTVGVTAPVFQPRQTYYYVLPPQPAYGSGTVCGPNGCYRVR